MLIEKKKNKQKQKVKKREANLKKFVPDLIWESRAPIMKGIDTKAFLLPNMQADD